NRCAGEARGLARRASLDRRRERQRAGFLPPPRVCRHAAQHRSTRRRVAGEHDDGKTAFGEGAPAMARPYAPPRLKRHHVVAAVVAIVVAVALVLNYYLW